MATPLPIPEGLAESCRGYAERIVWLQALPATVMTIARRWSLTVGAPYLDGGGSCAWVAPATLPDGTDAVLKLAMPHLEGENEAAGLQFWAGAGTVRLLDSDDSSGALLLERCRPGTSLRALPEPEQDAVLGDLLPRLWRTPPAAGGFKSLRTMLDHWARETRQALDRHPDRALAEEGLSLFTKLSAPRMDDVVLFTDLHAGNVLRAEREPWLAIDPKPFVGDRAFDATQHLFNCRERMERAPLATIAAFAERLGVDAERVRLWMFARAAGEPRARQAEDPWIAVAKRIAR